MNLPDLLRRLFAKQTQAAAGTYLRGIDVSRHNGVVNWDLVILSGIQFAFCKATEGTAYCDPRFDEHFSALAQRDIVRGAYHYYRPTMNPAGQAQNFYVAAHDTQLPPVLDVELYEGYVDDMAYYRNTQKAQVRADLQAILTEIEALFGMRPIIYTSAGFWNAYVGDWNGGYTLWVANYGASIPRLPIAWDVWQFWQYTANGSVPGISGNVDLNYFGGTIEQLRALCSSEPTPPPSPIHYATVLNNGLRIRSTPRGQIIGSLNAGDVVPVYAIEQLDTWAKIGNGYICVYSDGVQYSELSDPLAPGDGFDSPVGTEVERARTKVWPGDWFDAQGWGGGHTGADLNKNRPTWDSDAHAPVYAIQGTEENPGVVTYAGIVPAPSTWGGVIVIRHGDVYARYAHVENILVNAGDTVVKGQQIAQIGQYLGTPPNYHLHFDIADDTLASDPLNWPGYNPEFIVTHYKDPAPFIRAHRGTV